MGFLCINSPKSTIGSLSNDSLSHLTGLFRRNENKPSYVHVLHKTYNLIIVDVVVVVACEYALRLACLLAGYCCGGNGKERSRNVPKCKTHVQTCLMFCAVPLSVAAVVA